VLSELPTWDTNYELMLPPDRNEVQQAINQMSSGNAPGSDGLPPELIKSGDPEIII